MENVLNMKPYSYARLFTTAFSSIEDLTAALKHAADVANQHPSTILISGHHELALEAECLSDGSIVYNIILA